MFDIYTYMYALKREREAMPCIILSVSSFFSLWLNNSGTSHLAESINWRRVHLIYSFSPPLVFACLVHKLGVLSFSRRFFSNSLIINLAFARLIIPKTYQRSFTYKYICKGEWHSDETIFRFISPCPPWNLNQMYPLRVLHTVYGQIICPLHCCCSIVLTQSMRRDHHHPPHTFFSFRRTYLSFFIKTVRTHFFFVDSFLF